jgi:acetyl esterase/lipase
VHPLTVPVDGQPATGLYALPPSAPRGIVVIGHGHTADARDMAGLAQTVATNDGVIALAMDYRDTDLSTRFGWRVIEGAQDSIAAAQLFDRSCPGSAGFTNVAFGLSMGGNMSGLAVSSGARRADGSPLFDYWFDISGVTNVPEIYADAQAISLVPVHAVSSVGTTAMAEMQQEFGGTPLSNPLAYMANSPVLRASAMKSSGLKGAFVFHGVLDGEVTADMSAQMVAALAAAGIPVDFSTALFKLPGSPSGQTIDGYLGAFIPGYASPFAGHVSDVLMQAALEQLRGLYAGDPPPNGTSVVLSDGRLGVQPLVTLPRVPIPFPF